MCVKERKFEGSKIERMWTFANEVIGCEYAMENNTKLTVL